MIISVKVKPNSGRQEVKEVSQKDYAVYLKSKPENNKANIELVKLLGKYFKREVKILRGKTLSKKIVEVKNEI